MLRPFLDAALDDRSLAPFSAGDFDFSADRDGTRDKQTYSGLRGIANGYLNPENVAGTDVPRKVRWNIAGGARFRAVLSHT